MMVEMPNLAGRKRFSIHFFPDITRPLQHSTEKKTDLLSQKWISKCLIPRLHSFYKENITFPYLGK